MFQTINSTNKDNIYNPYLFIVGCPRSGTTLLERIVNAHPQIAIMHETHWISRFEKKRIGITKDGLVTSDLISALCNYHRFHLLRISSEELKQLFESSMPISYSSFVSKIFNLYGQNNGKSIVGDKTTGGYLRNIPLLHSLWPKAKFVHLIRDGRDVCLSMLKWPKAKKAAGRYEIWKDNPVATTALWWKWQMQLGINDGRLMTSDRYIEIRYESLVQNTENECKSLCIFLGINYDESMLRFNEGKTKLDSNMSANKAWLSPTPGLRDWRTQMAEKDLELFEAIAGDLLSVLGYERAFKIISPKIKDNADKFQIWWNKRNDNYISKK